jgi:hypothetical protein
MNPITSTLCGVMAAGAMTAGAISVATNASTSASPTPFHGSAPVSNEYSALQAEKQQLDRQLADRGAKSATPSTPAPERLTTPATFQVMPPPTTGGTARSAQEPKAEPPVTLPPVAEPPTTTPPVVEPPTTTPPVTTPPAIWVDDSGQQTGTGSQESSDDSVQGTGGSYDDR